MFEDDTGSADSDIAVCRSFKPYLILIPIILILAGGIYYGLHSGFFGSVGKILGENIIAVLLFIVFIILWKTM